MEFKTAVITISDKGTKEECENTNDLTDCAWNMPKLYKHKKEVPSMDAWIREAKKAKDVEKVGMYLTHNGVVRGTAKVAVRNGEKDTKPVIGMLFSYDKERIDKAIEETYKLEGIYYVRVWLNEGELQVGEDIMYVLIGGDIRPHVVDALDFLVGKIKKECVEEKELY